ncbi:unnamed protein product [Litomosoides sigmodontis]|uniref:Uncharacterized protein n=1 Tax=Litomosoides sigmodontis TaxID=42156 RepID=A0A3P6SHX1_LITSI|nr:unnamed protein product [Litomosoides sigmodontis]
METKLVLNSKILGIPRQAEVEEAKSRLSLMLKEEEQGEEVLALPSPGALNDMMSKVQKPLQFSFFQVIVFYNCLNVDFYSRAIRISISGAAVQFVAGGVRAQNSGH